MAGRRYGCESVTWSAEAEERLRVFEAAGYGAFPVPDFKIVINVNCKF